MSVPHKEVHTSDQCFGAYSQGIQCGPLLFVAGQVGAVDGTLAKGGVAKETVVALQRVARVVEAAGGSMGNVVDVVVFLQDYNDFDQFNAAYGTFFESHAPPGCPKPARACVAVAQLPMGARVEIKCTAHLALSDETRRVIEKEKEGN